MTDDSATPGLFDALEAPIEASSVSTQKKTTKRGTKAAEPKAAAPKAAAAPAPRKRRSAEDMAATQREISVSEFFTKNRHLLGFDSPLKALLTTVKEAVDNSMDACEEAGILPEISVEISAAEEENRFRVCVEDNGPGIVREQVGKIFGKLLYGSKFHKLSQTRGQQGIGIAAAGMYGQLTTGKSVRVVSRPGKRAKATEFLLSIDTAKNKPEIHHEATVEWEHGHGTRVEIEMEAKYQKGLRSVDMYLKQTAIANPHLTLHFTDPGGEQVTYERNTKEMPPETVEIKPHPHGVELGRLIAMLKSTQSRSLSAFLQDEFSRVGAKVAKDIVTKAAAAKTGQTLTVKSYPSRIAREEATALHKAINETKISNPSTDCIAPIGEDLVLAGLKKEIEADFYAASTRPPAVYRGNPFQIEVGIAYGKPGGVGLEVTDEGRIRKKATSRDVVEDLVAGADEPIRVLRFANRVPLLHQQSACAVTKGVILTNWKSYGLTQPRGALPIGPMAVLIHIASVWVPFTSESKEAIASYPEILKEIRLALQDCGRKLGTYIRKGKRLKREFDKRNYIEKYIPHIGIALQEILDLTNVERDGTVETLEDVLHKSRKF
ncbi:DNA topoisomerase VI subunit B [Engelhardtia mirabilis]|uniref:Type 2 DNA topoisomerase 6 subunit B n=1 Tax=Engelhardtia mirabilis TaxID=2528011 RepID=A0A518BMY7_9BACT|nr:DNA topoisomerase VI subunit B [Planctomycetes bacterium Pla133]QDV02632.1 DNA topoisomerase VI subunit B [Planctomycetes bacterium Pla86]